MKRRGRPKKYDYDQIDRDILKFLSPVKTKDMRLGYPTRRVWEYINKFYRRNYSRATVFARLMSLEERGLIERRDRDHRYYWKGLRVGFLELSGDVEYEVKKKVEDKLPRGKRLNFIISPEYKKVVAEYKKKSKFRRSEFERLGFDPLSILDELQDELKYFEVWDIVRWSPQEYFDAYKEMLLRPETLEERKRTCERELEKLESGLKPWGKAKPFIKEIILTSMQEIERKLSFKGSKSEKSK